MKLKFEPTSSPDIFSAHGDAELVSAFNERVQLICSEPLPESIAAEPLPKFAQGIKRMKMTASENGTPIRLTRTLFEDALFEIEKTALLDIAARNIGRLLQKHGMIGVVTKLLVTREKLVETVEIRVIATVDVEMKAIAATAQLTANS